MEDAVEPREDLLGHLGHFAVVERGWLAVSRGLAVSWRTISIVVCLRHGRYCQTDVCIVCGSGFR
jgi:hypothetical protein